GEWRGVCTCPAGQPPAAARGDVRGLVAKWERDALVNVLSQGERAVLRNCTSALRDALAAEGVQAGEVEQRLASARAGVTRTAMVWCKDIKDGSAAHAFENAIEELERAAIASALSQQTEARGVVGELVQMGDDEDGHPRLIINTTR